MKQPLLPLLALLLATLSPARADAPADTAPQPAEASLLARRFADSERVRFPEAWQLDHGSRLFFGYAQGVGCCAMLRMWRETDDRSYFDYVEQWADSLVNDAGEIHLYDLASYNLDFINSGKVLFDCYRETGKEKYRRAMEQLVRQLKVHPRTCDGGYWHKLIYQHQMWLDGLYMASPFLAQYGAEFGQPEWIDEAVRQIRLCHLHTHDPATGLYHHAWDESRSQRWADPETGHSPNFWGRSIGWWFMALVDNLDFIPADHPGRPEIISYIRGLADALPRYQRDGLWYQVIDCPERDGNYPEASVTAQLMYAYAKAVNRGYLDPSYRRYAEAALEGIRRELLVENPDGTLTLTRCCAVGGLGGTPYRDGSFAYYIGERIRDNDAKATGPFIMGCLELGRPTSVPAAAPAAKGEFGLTAALSEAGTGVALTWLPQPGTDPQIGYDIYRRVTGGPAIRLTREPVTGGATAFVDPYPVKGPASYAVVPVRPMQEQTDPQTGETVRTFRPDRKLYLPDASPWLPVDFLRMQQAAPSGERE